MREQGGGNKSRSAEVRENDSTCAEAGESESTRSEIISSGDVHSLRLDSELEGRGEVGNRSEVGEDGTVGRGANGNDFECKGQSEGEVRHIDGASHNSNGLRYDATGGDKDEDDEKNGDDGLVPFMVAHIPRLAITQSFSKGDLHLYEIGDFDIRGAPVIVGFSEATILPTLAVTYLAETLQLPLIGYISSTTSLPAAAIITRNFPLHMIQIFGDEQCVVIASELTPDAKSRTVAAHLAQLITAFAERHRCTNTILLKGQEQSQTVNDIQDTPSSQRPSEDQNNNDSSSETKTEIGGNDTTYITTSHFLSLNLLNAGYRPCRDMLVSGTYAWLLAEAPYRHINSTDVTMLIGAQQSKSSADFMLAEDELAFDLDAMTHGTINLLATLPFVAPSLANLDQHLEADRENFSDFVSEFLGTRLGVEDLRAVLADGIQAEAEEPPPGHMYM